jgi:hypothetical protein
MLGCNLRDDPGRVGLVVAVRKGKRVVVVLPELPQPHIDSGGGEDQVGFSRDSRREDVRRAIGVTPSDLRQPLPQRQAATIGASGHVCIDQGVDHVPVLALERVECQL